MKKVLLAVGHIGLENYIKNALSGGDEFEFVGESVHRENILTLIKETAPDVLVLRETLPGKTNIITLVYSIRSTYQNTRIVFLAGERDVGDELLSTLVNYGVYDILHSGKLLAKDIIALIETPNTYQKVKHLQPVPAMEEMKTELEFILPDKEEEFVLPVVEEEDAVEEELEEGSPKIEFVLPVSNPFEAFEALEANRQQRIRDAEKELVIPDARPEPTKEETPILEVKPKKESIEVPEVKEERPSLRDKLKFPVIGIPKIEPPPATKSPEPKKPRVEAPRISEIINNKKIIAFWGTKGGVGTSTIAHNLALSLASDNKRVIYIELNNSKPSVAYWYDLGLLSEGIETFSDYLANKEYRNLTSAIIKSADLRIANRKYEIFPPSLDFMFYSKEFLSGVKPKEKEIPLKDLYMYLFYQSGYDFVVLDIGDGVEKDDLVDMLMFSNQVFIVVSQDVSGLGYHILDLDNLHKNGIKIKEKSHYIVNKYVNSVFGVKKIKKWLEVENLTMIPNESEIHIDSNAEGQPLILKARDGKTFKDRIEELKKIL